jgi:hypothetical protein
MIFGDVNAGLSPRTTSKTTLLSFTFHLSPKLSAVQSPVINISASVAQCGAASIIYDGFEQGSHHANRQPRVSNHIRL